MEKSCGGDRSAGLCKRTRGRGNLSPKPAPSEWIIADPSIRHVLKSRPVKSGHRIQSSPWRVNRDSLRDSPASYNRASTCAGSAVAAGRPCPKVRSRRGRTPRRPGSFCFYGLPSTGKVRSAAATGDSSFGGGGEGLAGVLESAGRSRLRKLSPSATP